MEAVTTTIKVRRDVLDAMKRLAAIKQAQVGYGRPSVSGTLAVLAMAELERIEAESERKGRRRDA